MKRMADSIVRQRRLKKKRKIGCGGKILLDDEDERYITNCMEEKATYHGRGKDCVLYTNHHVEKRDLLCIVKKNYMKRYV